MRKLLIAATALLLLPGAGKQPAYRNPELPVERRVADLLGCMSLDEKIGQLWQPEYNPRTADLDGRIARGGIGSFVISQQNPLTAAERERLQHIAVEKSPLGIPILFGFDVIHGYRTIFPIPLAIAASWNTQLAILTARIAASEAWAQGIDMTYSPMVDVARDPRWGRISEGSGEDVLLNARFGAAMVQGYQSDDLFTPGSIGSCVKHFVGYGATLGGRDYQFTELSERALRETYLPPFKACVDAGAISVMSAFNDIAGTPASANALTINQILRKEWGFDGFVLSDWDSVMELSNHGVAADAEQAAVCALSAGVDVEMRSDTYLSGLKKAIEEKRLPIKTIDNAVAAVLRIKFRLGLFDNPFRNTPGKPAPPSAEARAAARKAAVESMVLLKNEGVLPVAASCRTMNVTGLWADNADLYGWWLGMGNYDDAVTAWEGIRAGAPEGMTVYKMSTRHARRSDIAIVCLGENGYMFGENNNRSDLKLPYGQEQLVRELKQQGNKVVAVIFCGRALDLSGILPYADAVLLAWHAGTETGNALADLLFGRESPSGRLPVCLPKSVGQVPVFYSDRTGGRRVQNKYMDLDGEPLFQFGHGLSYTSFVYSAPELSAQTIRAGEELRVRVTVTNTGTMRAKEVVQLYIHDKTASYTRPMRSLADFAKPELAPGESREVELRIAPEQLTVLDAHYRPQAEPGEFDLWIGGSPQTMQHTTFSLK